MTESLPALLRRVRACTLCVPHLPLGPRPVLQAGAQARILIAGQAPGHKVHASGIPFDDASGERLRAWLGLPREVFYGAGRIAIVPMGFCHPGRSASGDAPRMRARMPRIALTMAAGRYAMDWHLPQRRGQPLGETVRQFQAFLAAASCAASASGYHCYAGPAPFPELCPSPSQTLPFSLRVQPFVAADRRLNSGHRVSMIFAVGRSKSQPPLWSTRSLA